MNCSEFNRLLDNYENLSSDELDEMNNHAQNCESCKDELEFYRSIMLTAASLPVPEPPADLIERVNSRIDNLPKYQSGFDKVINNLRNNTKRYASLAACIAVGVVVGLNSKSISNMLNPQPDYDMITPVVDVADADSDSYTTQNTDDVPVTDDETNLPDTEPVAAENEKEEVSAPAVGKTNTSERAQDRAMSKPVAADVSVPNSNPAEAEKPKEPVAPTQQAEPAPVAETPAPSNGKTSKYTIARENYHIPTPSNETVSSVTEAPSETVQVSPSERYQIAMGNYEIPEEEKKTIRNKLIVNESDIKEITECMNKAGIRGTSDGCEASVSAFNNFLAMLDARGIYYTYAEASSDGALVSFNLLAN